MGAADDLAERLVDSIGPAVFEDTAGMALPPDPRTTWIDLQAEVVAVAPTLGVEERRVLARALVHAVLEQPSYGPTNRLDAPTFAFLLDALGDELAFALERSAGHMYGGQRYLRQHAWVIPGDEGARWLGFLAAADETHTSFMLQDMRSGKIARWPDDDWPARLDVLATLPARFYASEGPRVAMPALVRVTLAHADDERDHMVRGTANQLRAYRSANPVDDLDLVDWGDRARRPDLFRWILELMGDAGARQVLVAAAASAGLVAENDAAFLAAPLDRPAWADSEVPWRVDELVPIGPVSLPSRRLTAGDPWWTGGVESFPWVVTLDVPSISVDVIVASHPLGGRQCAALIARVADDEVESWRLIPGAVERDGYHVEVGIAGFGAVECYDSSVIHETFPPDAFFEVNPRWDLVDGGEAGSIAMCTVGPQHQVCRTWIGTAADGTTVMLVTDLGLLDLDLEREPLLPW